MCVCVSYCNLLLAATLNWSRSRFGGCSFFDVHTTRLLTLSLRCACAATFFQVFGRNLDTGLPVAYDDEHWRRVVGVLELSELQVGATHTPQCITAIP